MKATSCQQSRHFLCAAAAADFPSSYIYNLLLNPALNFTAASRDVCFARQITSCVADVHLHLKARTNKLTSD